MAGVVLWCSLFVLPWIRKKWVPPVLFVVLSVGLLLWTRISVDLIRFRWMSGLPLLRLILIMGGVLLFNLWGIVLAWKIGKAERVDNMR